ncbi:alpha/beta fold hydrolase [Sphingomonas lenta]|uniref:Alpha/beta hydrolase n=1 Tax=Sphingomonas lenta TaxID=1141887 RepID=A0A2A2SHY3_9SPHN|nr:alpha/beta hydrolase [Sphingomonas lenta]PAX08828.1 alpha/beta hydrolase [Sphingomonas lenta]
MRSLIIGLSALALAAPVHARQGAATFATAKPAQFQSDRIEVSVVGKGPDVILIPGLTSSPARAWAGTVDAVPGYRYYLVQVRGFSGVPAGANANGPVAAPVAEEIARYIREARLKRPAVVGHSMGGTIGMMLAARHPEVIARLMVVDMTPFMGAFFGMPNATAEQMRPMADRMREQMLAPPTPQGEAMMTQMVNGMANTESARPGILNDSRTSDRTTVANSYHELMTTDLRPELGRITVPTTVLYVRPAAVPITEAQMDALYRNYYANLKGASLVRVPDAAHFLQIDAPARFGRELRGFLAAK